MVLVLALLLVGSAAALPSPVHVETLERETPEGPLRGWVARVDLTSPRVSFAVTGPMERRAGDPERRRGPPRPDRCVGRAGGVDLAVNASFFARLGGSGAPLFGWTGGLPVDILGLSRSDGRTVSPPRRGGEGEAASPDPALLIDETRNGWCPCTLRATYAAERELDRHR